MRKLLISKLLVALLAGSVLTVACDDADPVPDYEYVGTATATLLTLSTSTTEPAAGDEVTVSVTYVNQADDPARELQALVRIGEEDFTQLSLLDESGAAFGEEIVRTFTYRIPNVASGTSITFNVLLNTQQMFPQQERVTVEVTA